MAFRTTYFPNRNWMIDVAFENIKDFYGRIIHGMSFSLGEDWMSIWDGSEFILDLNLREAPSTVTVSSTDPADTLTGTGAHELLIEGLDAELKYQTELIALAGTAPVTTTKTWGAINYSRVATAGVTGFNAGYIWIGNGLNIGGIPETKYLLVDPRLNCSHTFVFTIPHGHRAFPIGGAITSDDFGGGYSLAIGTKKPGDLLLWEEVRPMSGEAIVVQNQRFGQIYPAGTIITAIARANSTPGPPVFGRMSLFVDLLLESDSDSDPGHA